MREGVEALSKLLFALVLPLEGDANIPWSLRVESALPHSTSSRALRFRGLGTDSEPLEAFLRAAAVAKKEVSFNCLIERDGKPNERGEIPTERALLAFVFELELSGLFQRGGPLHDELGLSDVDEQGRMHLGVAHYKVAAAFADAHLRNGLFRPTAVIENGLSWILVFALERPVFLNDKTSDDLLAAARVIKHFLHSTRYVGFDAEVQVQDLLAVGHGRPTPMRVRSVEPKRRFVPGKVRAVGNRLIEELRKFDEHARPSAGSGPLPPAMALLTLGPDWTLADWALGARHRQVLAAGVDEDGCMDVRALSRIVTLAAERGHGWRDVEALLADPRHAVSSLMALGRGTALGLKREFLKALKYRDPRFLTRLPWGMRVARVEGTQPGETQRYRLYAKRETGWVHQDVSFDVLSSATKCRRTLGAMLERVLEPVPQRSFDSVLGLALADPRCTRPVRVDGTRPPRPLTAWVTDFLRSAHPYLPPDEGLSSDNPSGWPLIRDGVVVFPRKAVEAFLVSKAGVGRPGRKELTRALESLGGSELGVIYFAGSGRIRVWFCPMPAHVPRARA